VLRNGVWIAASLLLWLSLPNTNTTLPACHCATVSAPQGFSGPDGWARRSVASAAELAASAAPAAGIVLKRLYICAVTHDASACVETHKASFRYPDKRACVYATIKHPAADPGGQRQMLAITIAWFCMGFVNALPGVALRQFLIEVGGVECTTILHGSPQQSTAVCLGCSIGR
jgi:hypothetical protein